MAIDITEYLATNEAHVMTFRAALATALAQDFVAVKKTALKRSEPGQKFSDYAYGWVDGLMFATDTKLEIINMANGIVTALLDPDLFAEKINQEAGVKIFEVLQVTS